MTCRRAAQLWLWPHEGSHSTLSSTALGFILPSGQPVPSNNPHPLGSPGAPQGKAMVLPLDDVSDGAGEHEEPFWHLQGHWEEEQPRG